MSPPQLSVVVPVYNERDNLEPLVRMVREALREGPTWELLLVDDGSTDGSRERADACAAADARVRAIPLAHNYGQATAMQAGFDHARAPIVATMDGDLQNDAGDLPSLVAKLEEGYDLVVGYREGRQDRLLSRRVPSWVANRLLGLATGVRLRDTGCSLKVYRREMLTRFRLYADLHRFIPVLAVATAQARIVEVPTRHHARAEGKSKYGLERVGLVLTDLVAMQLIRFFRRAPLVYFGLVALPPLALATLAVSLAVVRPGSGVVLVGVSLCFAALSFFLVMIGLVAEVIVPERRVASGRARPMVRELVRSTESGR